MKTVLRKLAGDLAWVLFLIVIVVVVNHFLGLADWNNILLWTIPFPVGLVLGERKLVARWLVNIFRATGLLIKQENHPKEYVWPLVKNLDLYPDRLESTDLGYIKITLGWENALYYKVEIKDIKGTFSIDGSSPPDELQLSPSVNLEPFERGPLNLIPIVIHLHDKSMKLVKSIRERKVANGSIRLEFTAKLNGVEVPYELTSGYCYVA